MNAQSDKKRHFIIVVSGWATTGIGLALIGVYLWDAVISRWGEADQSLLFWFLPILLLGMASLVVGLVLLFYGVKHMRQSKSSE